MTDLSPEEIRAQFRLSAVLDLAQVEVTARPQGDVFFEKAHNRQFKRQKWALTFYSDRGGWTIDANQSAEETHFSARDALSILRFQLDTLFGITKNTRASYLEWRKKFHDTFGHTNGAEERYFRERLHTRAGMKLVFGEWFPVLCYSEDDI